MKQGFYNIDNYYRFHPAVKQDVKQEYRNMAFGPDKSKILSTGTRGGDIQKDLLNVGREHRVGFIDEGGKYTQTERGVKKVRGAKVLEKPKSYQDRVNNLSSESQKKLKEMANNRISKEKEAFQQRRAERDANFRKKWVGINLIATLLLLIRNLFLKKVKVFLLGLRKILRQLSVEVSLLLA